MTLRDHSRGQTERKRSRPSGGPTRDAPDTPPHRGTVRTQLQDHGPGVGNAGDGLVPSRPVPGACTTARRATTSVAPTSPVRHRAWPNTGNAGDGLVPSRPRGVHDCETGDDKRRPYKSRSTSGMAQHGQCRGRACPVPGGVHDCETGDDKRRPYKVPFDIRHGLAPATTSVRGALGVPRRAWRRARRERSLRTGCAGCVPDR